jgi:pimeloyl-ACP methyl ester carboxylesterase
LFLVTPSEATVQLLDRPDCQLAYVEQGTGTGATLLLHGMCCDHTHMQGLADHLSPTRRVVSLDLRGHGQSASTAPDAPFDLEAMCGDIDAVLDHLGIDRALLIGHSLGGSISLGYANRRPERVEALVMLDSGIRPLDRVQSDLGPRLRDLQSPTPPDPRAFYRERLFEPTDGDELIETVVAMMDQFPIEKSIALLRDLVTRFDSHGEALACTAPAAILLAGRPGFTDSRYLDDLGTNWQVARTLGAGHFVQLVVPDQVNAMLDRFIALLPD